jgi:hypothetical protein
MVFSTLSPTELEDLTLILLPTISEISSEELLATLQHSFTGFLKNHQVATFSRFYLTIYFYKSENALGIAPFPEFIKANKEKVEEYEEFKVRI